MMSSVQLSSAASGYSWRMLSPALLLLATLLLEECWGAFVVPPLFPHRQSPPRVSTRARERKWWSNRHVETLLAADGAAVNGANNNDGGIVAVATAAANGDTSDALGEQNQMIVSDEDDDNKNNNIIFDLIAGRSTVCLYQSDLQRDAVGKGAGTPASSATNWIHDASAFALQQTMDQLRLKSPEEALDQDEATVWWRWIRSVPVPTILDLSHDFCRIVNATLTDEALAQTDQRRNDFLGRLGCRLLTLPSGAALSSPLTEPPASIIYGKLLYGGVTRYRLLGSHNSNSNGNKPPRKAGQRTEVQPTSNDKVDAWMQYGGPDRMYEAVDMGPAAVLEVVLLPRGKNLLRDGFMGENNMVIQGMAWKPQEMFGFWDDQKNDDSSDKTTEEIFINSYTTASRMPSGKDRNDAFRSDFMSVVGGLQPQIDAIVRRVLDGRVIRPVDDDGVGRGVSDDSRKAKSATSATALEAEELELLGLTPCRGLLLYGPPGTGKTLLARELAKALRARTPKIVSAPELLDRWVGGSEKLVRLLFADAEAELAACKGDASQSALHVVVIDEIDAVFRKRSAAEDSGEATRSSVVNQILSKLDGVNAIPNVLLIGMTNRRELLDEALLRPGRLEVQVEIPLPNRDGRREILQIHFCSLRQRGRLSRPLCCAIDGVPFPGSSSGSSSSQNQGEDENVSTTDVKEHNNGRKRQAVKKAIRRIVPSLFAPVYDLASDSVTGGFSGADIAGLVRCAGSLALARCRKDGNGVEGLLITLEDVKQALVEIKR